MNLNEKISFSHEPVGWIAFLIICLQVLTGLLTGNLDTTLLSTLGTAASAVFIRQKVYSPATHNGELAEQAAELMDEPVH